jgi:hypothetical protein
VECKGKTDEVDQEEERGKKREEVDGEEEE